MAGFRLRAVVVVCLTSACVASIALVDSWWTLSKSGEVDAIVVRDKPIALFPLWSERGDAPYHMSSENELRALRDLMRPTGQMKSVSYMLHFLSFLAPKAANERVQLRGDEISIDEMVRALLDGTEFSWYRPTEPLFYLGGDGILRSALSSEADGEAHRDQVLATLGDIGMKSSRRIRCVPGHHRNGRKITSGIR